MEQIDRNSLENFGDAVIQYLEYLNFPDYVEAFHLDRLARPVSIWIKVCRSQGFSYRLTALCIFGFTMKYHVLPRSTNSTKH